MWDKPKELTNYEDNGYEIACGSPDTLYDLTPAKAIESWKSSYHHNNVILNKENWERHKWNAIGIGVYKSYAVIWFGKAVDNEGEPAK